MNKILTEEQQKQLLDMIEKATRIAVLGHVSPDGDALGSTLTVKHWMQRIGKQAEVIVPNSFPSFLEWMPGADSIVVLEREVAKAKTIMDEADLIIVCDLNEPSRLQTMEPLLAESHAPRILLDHHLNPSDFCQLTISHPELSAACELLCRIFIQTGEIDRISHDEAICLYTGLMTDTINFTVNSSRPDVFHCVARLLELGIDKDQIYRNVFWTATPARMRLTGFLLYSKMELIKGLNVSIMSLTNAERKILGVRNGDTEGIVNMPLQIQGMKLSVLLTEDTERPSYIRFSLRSVGDFPCNEMSARFFNGGGHKNAAGGHLECGMKEAIARLKAAVQEYADQLR